MVGLSPRSGHGTREDAPGSGMGISGMWGSGEDAPGSGMGTSRMQYAHLDEEAVLQRRDVLAVAADLRRSRSGASCVIPFPPRTPTSARRQQPPTPPQPQWGTPDMPTPSWGRSRIRDVARSGW